MVAKPKIGKRGMKFSKKSSPLKLLIGPVISVGEDFYANFP
jgi:hypothetical protein